jgi:hypothetical protein
LATFPNRIKYPFSVEVEESDDSRGYTTVKINLVQTPNTVLCSQYGDKYEVHENILTLFRDGVMVSMYYMGPSTGLRLLLHDE